MKNLILFTILLSTIGCASPQKVVRQGYDLPPAMREIFRGGQLKGLEDHTDPEKELGMPSPYDMVQHTCVSQPIWGLNGEYIRTAVRCY